MQNNKYIFKIIIIFIVAFVLGAWFSYTIIPYQPLLPVVQEKTQSISVMFDYGNDKIDVVSLLIPDTDTTLFDMLKKASDDKKITFNYKDYGGSLGVFIQSINDISETGEKYWQYWVNNMYAQVGVSFYTVRAGDIIIFKLIKGQI